MTIELDCPKCGLTVKITEALLGKKLRCKKCQGTFTAEDPSSPFEEVLDVEVVEDESRPTRRPKTKRRFDEDEEEYDQRPRRRLAARTRGRSLVQIPAIIMMCLGGLGFALWLLNALYVMIKGPANVVVGNAQMTELTKLSLSGIGIAIGLIWPIVVTYGGYKMKVMENYGSVIVAAVFMMLPCNLGCILGIPLAIAVIVVLCQEDVRRSFTS